MATDRLNLRRSGGRRIAAARTLRAWSSVAQALAATALAVALTLLQAPAANAAIDCLPVGLPLVKIPEIVSQHGVLRGTIVLADEEQRLIFRSPGGKPGQPGTSFECQPQRVRVFRSPDADPPMPIATGRTDPMPGPVLRARVGDIIQLTFVNQINANRFGASIDLGDKPGTSGTGCDMTNPGNPSQGYPTAGGDTWPDCFHGSSTGNIHFHGTHTNPNGTGDNVFLEIRPSPRRDNAPTMSPTSVSVEFEDFFAECTRRLRVNPLAEWPTTWNDAPQLAEWIKEQTDLLQKYQDKTGQTLWTLDQQALQQQPPQWPQYYIGAFPYCFRLPEYVDPTEQQSVAGQAPTNVRPIMGQAPGTHWYHAHKHGSTAIDVANGMTGVFIIEGQYDEDLNTFYGKDWTHSQPVLVINQLGVSPNLVRSGAPGPKSGATDKGPDFSINGRFQPMLDMAPGEVQLWRIANTSGRSGAFFAGLPPGFEWRRLAQDGVQLADSNYKSPRNQNASFLMAAGNRVDLLVKAPPPGLYPVLVQHAVDPGDLPSASPVVLFFVRVRADVPPATGNRAEFIPNAPRFPKFLADITDQEVQNKTAKVIKFKSDASGPGYTMHTIDGKKFQDGDKPFTANLNTAEEWKIVNESYGFSGANSQLVSHPFHIHLNPFQLVEVFDPNQTVRNKDRQIVPKYVFYNNPAPDPAQCYLNPAQPDTWKDCHNDPGTNRIWWDVFPIPSGTVATDAQGNPLKDPNGNYILVPGYFRMRSRFVDFPGSYVMHCHILAHEDRGMMATVTVGPPWPPVPSHH